MAALAFRAGCGPQYLAARWTDDVRIYEAIALRDDKIRSEERKDLAVRIADNVRRVIDGSG